MAQSSSRSGRFTLAAVVTVTLLAAAATAMAQQGPPAFSKTFLPDTIGPGSVATLRFDIFNESGTPVTSLAFTDTLPAGVEIASPARASTTCGGALTAPSGGDTVTLADGVVGAFATCRVFVDVTADEFGTYMNVSGDLTSSAGTSGPATDDLIVSASRPGFSKVFAPDSVPLGGRSNLTFTIDNSASEVALQNFSFVDNLPVGMVVAAPANAATDCGHPLSPPTLTAGPGTSLVSLTANGNVLYPALAGGAICAVTVDVVAGAVGVLGNTSNELLVDFSTSSGRAAATLTVQASTLAILKAFTDDPVPAGDTVTLEFTIANFDRSTAATGISFTDDLDAVLSGLVAVGLPANDVCGQGSQLSGTSVLSLTGGNLAPEGQCSFGVTLQVPEMAATGAYPNVTSQVTADVGGGPVTGPPAADVLFVSPAPRLAKEYTDDPVGAGGLVTLEFTITNTSQTNAATGITFYDELTTSFGFPVSVTLPGPDPCGAGSALALTFPNTEVQGLSLTDGSLAAGASCTFAVVIDVPADQPAGAYLNVTTPITATVDGETAIGSPAVDTLLVVGGPRLAKEFTDDPAPPGGTVTLEFTLSHDDLAAADATGITFADDLEATLSGLVAVGLPQGGVCGPGSQIDGASSLSFTGGWLAPGASCTFSVTLDVPGTAPAGAHPNKTSKVAATVGGVTTVSPAAGDDLMITGLVVSKEFVDDPVIPGDLATLRFTLDNLHPTEDAGSIFFTDSLSAVLAGLAAEAPLPDVSACGTGAAIVGTNLLQFTGGSVAAGTSCSFDVAVRVPGGAADGTYTNVTSSPSATIGGTGFLGKPASDALTVDSKLILLAKQFTDDPVAPGGTVTLEFTLTNLAAGAASDVGFSDALGAVLSGLTASGLPVAACGGTVTSVDGGSTIELAGASLAAAGSAGDSCTFSLTLQVPGSAPAGITVTNTTSEVTGTVNGLSVAGDPAKDTLRISNLKFSKGFDGPAVPGSSPVLTFTIENLDATAGVADLSFTDNLQSVLTGLVAVGLPLHDVCGAGSLISGTSLLVFAGGNLPPGGSCTFDVDLQVPPSAIAGTYTNTTSELVRIGLPVGAPATAELIVENEKIPPTVLGIDSQPGTGDGVIDACEAVRVAISSLLVRYSEPMLDPPGDGDPDDVTNPDNYLVVAAGANADFETNACGTVFGDDVAVPIAAVTYDDLAATATLILAGPLPAAPIRLVVCGSTSVHDRVGNPLDGDGNGVGGDDFVLTFRSDPDNLLANGHFDCDAGGWVLTSAVPGEINHSPVDADGSAVSGSLEFLQLAANTDFSAGQCVDVASGAAMRLAAVRRVAAAPAVLLSLDAGCESFAGTGCAGSPLGQSSTVAIFGDSSGSWLPVELTVAGRPGRESILCSFDVRAPEGDDFSLWIDRAVLELEALLFADGFESGDTSAWTAAAGGTP